MMFLKLWNKMFAIFGSGLEEQDNSDRAYMIN